MTENTDPNAQRSRTYTGPSPANVAKLLGNAGWEVLTFEDCTPEVQAIMLEQRESFRLHMNSHPVPHIRALSALTGISVERMKEIGAI